MKGWIVDAGEWKSGDVVKIAFFSDPHIEIEGENKNLKKALDEAAAEGCRMWFNGDISDWIYYLDKRYTPARHQKQKESPEDDIELDGIIDNAVDYLVEFLEPYKHIIDGISYGNHETVAIKKYLTNPIRRVCRRLGVRSGAYRQIVRYKWSRKDEHGNPHATRTLDHYIHHGSRGVATKNKGMLALQDMYRGADADIYIVGHGHRGAIDPGDLYYYMDREGTIREGIKKGMQIPGFQSSGSESGREWEDKFYQGTPIGYGIVEITFDGKGLETECRVRIKN